MIASETKGSSDRKFVLGIAVIATVLAAIPFLLGTLATPDGGRYLGFQYATDDHMVYAAWMRQAMDGHFFFDNRFTTQAQPGLTVHLYFLVLGWIAKITGISLASNLARLGLTFAFPFLVANIVRRTHLSDLAQRWAIGLSVFGGGFGFLAWQMFGETDPTSPLASILLGRLPTDVWQPEGFVFPSMLTNGLFMVSLSLILLAIRAYLDARESWRAVPMGVVAVGLLMNIHSYDVLLVGLVLVGFVAASAERRLVSAPWITRAVVITLGVVPPALWFAHVLQSDAVFQARAATETYAPNFRPVLFGYLPLIILGLVGLTKSLGTKRALAGVSTIGVLFLGLFVAASGHSGGYFLSAPIFGLVLVVAIVATVLCSSSDVAVNLLIAWAFVGTVAIYFPGLFQRKLAMGLSLPWAVLAGLGVAQLTEKLSGSVRTLAWVATGAILGATSLRWLSRELAFISGNVSRTAVHPVFLGPDATQIVDKLNGLQGRHVVIAPAGQPAVAFADLNKTPVDKLTPSVPDLNPIVSGLAGVYTYAGHWSETPKYLEARGVLDRLYFSQMTPEARNEAIKKTGADYVIALNPEMYPNWNLFDFRELGEVIVDGKQFRLIHLR